MKNLKESSGFSTNKIIKLKFHFIAYKISFSNTSKIIKKQHIFSSKIKFLSIQA